MHRRNDLFVPLATPRRERRAVVAKRYGLAQWYCADHMARTAARMVKNLRAAVRF